MKWSRVMEISTKYSSDNEMCWIHVTTVFICGADNTLLLILLDSLANLTLSIMKDQ